MRGQLLLIKLLPRNQCALILADLLDEFLFDFQKCEQSSKVALLLELVEETQQDLLVVLFVNYLFEQTS